MENLNQRRVSQLVRQAADSLGIYAGQLLFGGFLIAGVALPVYAAFAVFTPLRI